MDSAGVPIKLTDVIRIEPLDLSPIILSGVFHNKRRFRFKRIFKFGLELEEDCKQLLIVDNAELGLNVFARTREQLIDEIGEQVAFLWDAYARCDDEKLTPEAQKLKQSVLNAVEVDDAA